MNNNNNFKIVLIGDSGVGKSSLVYWFMYEKNSLHDTSSTIGAAFSSKIIEVDKKKIKLQIWDTAGQERYRSMSRIYYKGSIGCLCVFDVTNQNSFNNLTKWIHEYIEGSNLPHVIILVANKSDLSENKWKVTKKEIDDFSKKENYKVIYTECINGTNVNEIFYVMSKLIISLPDSAVEKTRNDGVITDLSANLSEKSTCKC